MERRSISGALAGLEIRADEGKPARIVGYGAVYYRADDQGTEYKLWTDAFERIMPGAFDAAVKGDVRSLFNHDPNIVLGRSSGDAATLRLTVDSTGLRYDVEPPDTQLVRDQVLAPIRRGDVSGSSFMFRPVRVKWGEEDRDGRTVEIRELHEVELFEVGPVVFPAYSATTSDVRAARSDMDLVRAENRAWRDSEEFAARQRRESEIAASVRIAAIRTRL